MADLLLTPLKIALVIFVAGSLLEIGLRLDPRDVLAGLRNVRFVAYTLLWGFGSARRWLARSPGSFRWNVRMRRA